LPTIRTPVLITHGADDAIVTAVAVEQHKAGIAHAQVELIANAGRACFWDDAETFNRRLQAFADGL
jgi:non-heme chloroperoxidase